MAEASKFFETQIGKREILLKRNAEQYEKILSAETVAYQKELDKRAKAEAELESKIAKLRAMGLKEEADALKGALEDASDKRYLAEVALEEAKKALHSKALKTAEIYELNQYKKLSAAKRREYHDSVYAELKEGEFARKQELASEQAKLQQLQKERSKIKDKRGAGKAATKEKDAEIAAAQEKIRAIEDVQKKQEEAAEASRKFSKVELFTSSDARKEKTARTNEKNQEKIDTAADKVEEKKAKLADLEEQWQKKSEKRRKDIEAAKKRGDDRAVKNLELLDAKEREKWEKRSGYLEAEQELIEANQELEEAQQKAKKDALKNVGSEFVGAFVDKSVDRISDNIDAMYGEQGRMMGRLQGSGENWALNVVGVSAKVGMSGVVSQKDVVAKMVQLVDSGVAYNLEMRAFLAETSENIASTFDAANGTLLRLIRVQQSDTTAARLGMEASLTKLFNKYFKDTSYLTDSGPSDSVKTAILDATAAMNKNEGLEFEFTVQKWLGSLYSLGMSSEAVGKIAEGLNYLGTGNVSALSNDSALQTLLSMSAARAGKSYSAILSGGLSSDDTNDLLKAMIEYLAEIARSQDNNVTKAAYADLFNMSLTDLSTFTSLTSKELTNIYKTSTSYNKLMLETQTQLLQSLTRVSIGSMVDTAIENAEVGAASLIGSNPVTYGTWKALALLKEYVGEVKIPGVTGMGTGIASGLDLLNLAQTGMAGMGLLGSLVMGIGSMATGGALNLSKWNYNEYSQRGNTLSLLDSGVVNNTSMSATIGVGSASGADASSVSMQQGKEAGMEASGTSSAEMEEQKEIPQKILNAINGEGTPTVIGMLQQIDNDITKLGLVDILQEIDNRLHPGRVFYTAIAGTLNNSAAEKVFELSSQVAYAKTTSNMTTENNTTSAIKDLTNTVSKIGVKGGVGTSSDDSVMDMSSVIEQAVKAAIDDVMSSYSTNGSLSVYVKGGMY